MERVYLGDWLYNAGIIGFLKINSHLWDVKNHELKSKDENLLKIGENYIEFDRKIFDGFAKRYFDYAFNQYGRYDHIVSLFNEYLKDLESLENPKEEIISEIHTRLNKILSGFSLLKKKLGKLPSKNIVKKDLTQLTNFLKNALKILKEDKEEFWETDVQIYLRGIYGQKSFLNLSVNKNRFQKFQKDFEETLLENKNKKDKKYKCINCSIRQAKKDTIFDTGISKFYGLNPDSINFVWNFNSKLPLCEICEIIYFSYFAGLTPFRKDNKPVYYFVNSDTSIENLLKENLILEQKLTTDISENKFIDFFTELVLMSQSEKARYFLANTVVIELDLNSDTMPKIYSFNISKEKAEYLQKNKEDLKKLSKAFYEIKNERFSILPQILEKILDNSLSYEFLNNLLRIYLKKVNNSVYYKTNINPYQMQILNLLIKDFLEKIIFGGRSMDISNNELWFVYNKGAQLAKKLKDKNAENKIQSIAYKLLNALRVGNTNQFMDILIRTYMAFEEEIPSSFVKTISDKNLLYPLGYSFLNGFLGKELNKEGLNNE